MLEFPLAKPPFSFAFVPLTRGDQTLGNQGPKYKPFVGKFTSFRIHSALSMIRGDCGFLLIQAINYA